MSETTRITLLLGAMEDVLQSHIETLMRILEMLEGISEEEKLDMNWSLGWNLARMQSSLQSASHSLCRAMERSGLEPPAIDLEGKSLDNPEDFILSWTEHLANQVDIIHLSYHSLQEEVLRNPEDFDDEDDFWDESLRDLLDN